MLVSLSDAENINKAIIRFVNEKEGRRPCPAVVMAATIRIPASSRRIFYFLQDENSRRKVCMVLIDKLSNFLFMDVKTS